MILTMYLKASLSTLFGVRLSQRPKFHKKNSDHYICWIFYLKNIHLNQMYLLNIININFLWTVHLFELLTTNSETYLQMSVVFSSYRPLDLRVFNFRTLKYLKYINNVVVCIALLLWKGFVVLINSATTGENRNSTTTNCLTVHVHTCLQSKTSGVFLPFQNKISTYNGVVLNNCWISNIFKIVCF